MPPNASRRRPGCSTCTPSARTSSASTDPGYEHDSCRLHRRVSTSGVLVTRDVGLWRRLVGYSQSFLRNRTNSVSATASISARANG
ncbi:hypothetical protein ACFFX0_18070 [Citricoccus parietis]|uniref:Uncharacterized protein n=1 Tax=Citricoccus parietis TaxID=592307 RepID=A0ABV5G245_9MICC